MVSQHQLVPGESVNLKGLSTSGHDFHTDRDKAQRQFKRLRKELIKLQYLLYAEGKQKLLIVFQAMDAGGKDGVIRRVFSGVNPQGVKVTSFKVPSKEELAHDFLWRIHHHVPGAGMIAVFNRSHYEDVLVVRVDKLVARSVWEQRYQQINDFERLLAENGTKILKFYLHISPQEQQKRFQDRLDTPHKQWKFSLQDLEKRKQWDKYQEAYESALSRCTTELAPWYVVPADQKWYRNLAVIRVIVHTLKAMEMQFPAPPEGINKVVIT